MDYTRKLEDQVSRRYRKLRPVYLKSKNELEIKNELKIENELKTDELKTEDELKAEESEILSSSVLMILNK